jgi:hypothetical protein
VGLRGEGLKGLKGLKGLRGLRGLKGLKGLRGLRGLVRESINVKHHQFLRRDNKPIKFWSKNIVCPIIYCCRFVLTARKDYLR